MNLVAIVKGLEDFSSQEGEYEPPTLLAKQGAQRIDAIALYFNHGDYYYFLTVLGTPRKEKIDFSPFYTLYRVRK